MQCNQSTRPSARPNVRIFYVWPLLDSATHAPKQAAATRHPLVMRLQTGLPNGKPGKTHCSTCTTNDYAYVLHTTQWRTPDKGSPEESCTPVHEDTRTALRKHLAFLQMSGLNEAMCCTGQVQRKPLKTSGPGPQHHICCNSDCTHMPPKYKGPHEWVPELN